MGSVGRDVAAWRRELTGTIMRMVVPLGIEVTETVWGRLVGEYSFSDPGTVYRFTFSLRDGQSITRTVTVSDWTLANSVAVSMLATMVVKDVVLDVMKFLRNVNPVPIGYCDAMKREMAKPMATSLDYTMADQWMQYHNGPSPMGKWLADDMRKNFGPIADELSVPRPSANVDSGSPGPGEVLHVQIAIPGGASVADITYAKDAFFAALKRAKDNPVLRTIGNPTVSRDQMAADVRKVIDDVLANRNAKSPGTVPGDDDDFVEPVVVGG